MLVSEKLPAKFNGEAGNSDVHKMHAIDEFFDHATVQPHAEPVNSCVGGEIGKHGIDTFDQNHYHEQLRKLQQLCWRSSDFQFLADILWSRGNKTLLDLTAQEVADLIYALESDSK